MKYLILFTIFLSGCARTQCEIAIDSLQPVQKIPKTAKIEIGSKILANDGGHTILKNYVNMSNQIENVRENCQKK